MMNKCQRTIYETLMNIRRDIDQRIKPSSDSRGICSIVYAELLKYHLYEYERMDYLDAIKEFKQLCAEWPEGTRDPLYPVPATDSKNIHDAIKAFNSSNTEQFWLVGNYAKRRYDLLCYLLIRYKDM